MITKEKNIHYFPGHMKKALREIAPYVKLVDLVVEVVDARAPYASRNPFLKELIGSKEKREQLSAGLRNEKQGNEEEIDKYVTLFESLMV